MGVYFNGETPWSNGFWSVSLLPILCMTYPYTYNLQHLTTSLSKVRNLQPVSITEARIKSDLCPLSAHGLHGLNAQALLQLTEHGTLQGMLLASTHLRRTAG